MKPLSTKPLQNSRQVEFVMAFLCPNGADTGIDKSYNFAQTLFET
jgi:hypothetical protein